MESHETGSKQIVCDFWLQNNQFANTFLILPTLFGNSMLHQLHEYYAS